MQSLEVTRTPARFTFEARMLSENTISHQCETVYLVDDYPCVREALAELLVAFGKEVVSFATGAEYLKWRRKDSAACLILDMMLPDMCGLDLQSRLPLDDRPPIIFVSGRASIAGTVLAMKGGALEFLTKPVNPEALRAAVDAAFGQDRQRRQTHAELSGIRKRFSMLTPRERQVLPLLAAAC